MEFTAGLEVLTALWGVHGLRTHECSWPKLYGSRSTCRFTAHLMNGLQPKGEEHSKILVFWQVFEDPSKLLRSSKGKGVFKSEGGCS